MAIRRKIIITQIFISFLAATNLVHAEEMVEWKDCVKEAKINHPTLLSAMEKVNQAKASKEITRSVMLPQITGNASESTAKNANLNSSGTSTSTSSASTSTSTSKSRQNTTYDYNLTGQQLLFDGFKSSFDLSAAERNIISSRYNYDVTSSNIRLSLKTAFTNLLSAQVLAKVTAEIEDRRKQNLELVRLKYEGGREHRGSLLTSEADLAQATYDVNQAMRNIYLSQRQLTKELGRSSFRPMTAEGSFEVADPVKEKPDFEMLAATTPLLQQLIAQKEAARFGVRSAYANFFPQVYANTSIDNTNINAFPDKNEWSVGTSLTLPIFDGANRIAAVSKAKAVLGQANDDERSGRDGVILTMANTWTTLQNAIENVGVQQKSLEATEERAKIARAEYAIGLMSFDNWIIIENNLAATKKTLVNAQANALIAEANWIQAKGGTLDYDEE